MAKLSEKQKGLLVKAVQAAATAFIGALFGANTDLVSTLFSFNG